MQGAFFVEKIMKEYRKKTIYCPDCGRKVGMYDGRSQIDKRYLCKKCNKRIVYRVANGKVEVKNRADRTTSSGMVFGV